MWNGDRRFETRSRQHRTQRERHDRRAKLGVWVLWPLCFRTTLRGPDLRLFITFRMRLDRRAAGCRVVRCPEFGPFSLAHQS
jgi:hypothetical protein